jgi:hypothetical protein
MPPKNTNKPRRPQRKSGEQVERLRVKCSKTYNGTAATAQLFLTLDDDASSFGLPVYSQTVLAYFDMYRYFRIKRLAVRVIPLGATATVPQGGMVLAYLAPGVTVDPTTSDVFETPHQVLTSNNYAFIGELVMSARDFAGIGTWCVTQGDATDEIFTSFGDIWIASETATATMNISNLMASFMVFLDLHLEFKTLLDPATISALVQHRKNPSTETTSKPSHDHPPRIDGVHSARICADDDSCPHCHAKP